MDEMKDCDPKHWDAVAEDYASSSEPITRPYGLDALAELGPRRGLRHLEAAAGTGGLALEAARSGCDVTATDSSPAMVARIAARAAGEGLANVTATVMDGQALDFPEGSFDLVCSAFGVMFFPDHRAGLSELKRVLAPGGKAAVVVWSHPDRMGHLSDWRELFRDDFPEFGDLERPAAWRAMDTADSLAAEMQAAEFRGVEVQPLRHAWVVPSSAWRPEEGRCHPFFERMLARLGPDSPDRARARLTAAFDERYGDGPATFPAEAWLAIGHR
ncbi:MAG: hypothetical protein BGO49_12740 [Planctomycetales bacterium 71-10]|nr:MAG: hypothetical protein BGO49_12740 [Planctomycetales bacterium 71-10]